MAAPPHCHDRVHHWGPRPAGVAAYPNGGRCSAARTPCCHEHQGGDYLVCDASEDDTQVLLGLIAGSPPAINKFNHVGVSAARTPPLTWNPPASGKLKRRNWNDPPWEGFLTRVCQDCEHSIQSYRWNVDRPYIPRPDNFNQWHSWPDNSCTCQHSLGIAGAGPTRCYPHVLRTWQGLVERKNTNDRWLRDIDYRPNVKGRLIYAGPAKKKARVLDGTWRACRCGRDCTPQANPPPQEVVSDICAYYLF